MTVEEILAALQEILDAAAASPDGDMTEEQVARYEELEGKLQTRRRTEEIQKRHAAYGAVVTPVLQNRAKLKDDDTLERAFEHYLRTGKENADIVELRAQSEGTPSEGGYLVPEGFRQKLVDRMKAFGGVGEVVEQLTTETGQNYPWPTVDDTANLGEIVQEGNTFSSGADLVLGSTDLGAYSYAAGGASSLPLRVSRELLQDAAFDVQGLVSNKLGERIARLQAPHIVKGTGSSQPLGLIYGKTGVQLAANTGITYKDLLHFIHSVDPAYREGGSCRWAFNDTSLEVIKGITDSHGDPIWRPSTADMATETGGGTLMGYPVTIDQSFDNISLASGTVNWGAFGDLKEGYVRRTVKSVEILVDPIGRMHNREVQFSAWARMDATVQNPFAYSALTGKA